jgi:hypothetical protein
MARASSQMDEVEHSQRLIYLSWHPDPLASTVFDKLEARLKLSDWDDHGRMLMVVACDPQQQVGEESAQIRQYRADATDFVAIVTTEYLLHAKTAGDTDEIPDLLYFVQAKAAGDDPDKLTMWIFPAEAISLHRVSFRSANIARLDFDWWHGWRGDTDRIPLPSDTPRSIQEFNDDLGRRVDQILKHPDQCTPCGHDEGGPPDDT